MTRDREIVKCYAYQIYKQKLAEGNPSANDDLANWYAAEKRYDDIMGCYKVRDKGYGYSKK